MRWTREECDTEIGKEGKGVGAMKSKKNTGMMISTKRDTHI